MAKADRSTTGVTVYEDFDEQRTGRRSRGHRASSCVAVRLTDPEVIGQLITRATENLAAQIDGPSWQIAADNPLRLEAARQAAASSRRKAHAYAEGVGAKLGQLIQLIEAGTGRHVGAVGPKAVRVAAAAEAMPVEPGEHEVAASVDATFALELR